MDRSTLSNYGWIIVTTIIIALMIILATPLGNYMKDSFTGITEQFTEAANVEQGIEDGVVGGYKKIEDGVVEGFNKVTDKCVEKLFTKEGETVEEAKKRLSKGN